MTIRIGNRHGEPLALVRAAAAHQERAPRSREDRYTAYDEVWCVIDVEAPRPHESLPGALQLAEEEGIRVVLSNPCFELWLLLHHEHVSGYLTSAQAQQRLERLGCGYSVARKHLDVAALPGDYARARERAGRLRADEPHGTKANPWTDVDVLVDRLTAAAGRDH